MVAVGALEICATVAASLAWAALSTIQDALKNIAATRGASLKGAEGADNTVREPRETD
ncbi:hypothetical protein AB5I39_01455 [Sphingomonas sp. MMS24-J45]|uniref:hypothetical protein n=1 Tax=Sphingomonas sp. MMS24-J45 TaxID=3238806 RepID=UPI00384D36B3